MVETRGLVCVVEALDAMLKTADVSYAGQKRVGSGLVAVLVEGDVAAVKAAVDAGNAGYSSLALLPNRSLAILYESIQLSMKKQVFAFIRLKRPVPEYA